MPSPSGKVIIEKIREILLRRQVKVYTEEEIKEYADARGLPYERKTEQREEDPPEGTGA